MGSASVWVMVVSALALGLAFVYLRMQEVVRLLLRAVLSSRYSFRVVGRENVPLKGGVVLAGNHTSWLDGFVLSNVSPRGGKVMVNASFFANPLLHHLAVRVGIIPTPFSGPRAIRAALQGCREALVKGAAVGIFPEGQISRTGLPGPFYRGIEVILKGHEEIPVIPVGIDNLWGSVFSRSGGKFFLKRPKGWRRTINVVFGAPVSAPVTIWKLRLALMEAMVAAYELRGKPGEMLDSLDPALPRWEHQELGLLTASTGDIHLNDIHQVGHKEGSVGLAVPGVAIRAVDEWGAVLPAATEGRIEALKAGRGGWLDTGRRGSVDADGFVRLGDEAALMKMSGS